MILWISRIILIDVQNPLDANLKELGIGPIIDKTEVAFITKLPSAIHLLTRISQTVIVN